MATRILQIVPRLSPDVDGVGDYALLLAQRLRDRNQIGSDFLVFRPSRRTRSRVEGFPVHRLEAHTVAGLLERIPTGVSTVVLQYSNYPYLLGKLDTPLWLVTVLTALKRRGLRTVVMFHELPTLRYRGLRCPNLVQQRVSRGLARAADVVVTNNSAFQRVLSGWATEPVHCIPNFSTIGEPSNVPPLSDRDRALVVFGSSDRLRLYHRNQATLRQVCQRLDIHTLYDVGRPIDWTFDQLAPAVKVVRTGFLPAAEVSQLMLNAVAGLFDYRRFPHNLAKSTVYAAYCAHGLLPLCNQRPLRSQDGIVAHQHYLDTQALQQLPQQTPNLLASLQTVASNAHQQYSTHRLDDCARVFTALVGTAVPDLPVSAGPHRARASS
ncbi:MAG: glycosyltransferase [Leptolyngbya sp. SIO4C1]|nr:glycosyltransferase [Leptolyngbya sp. SIO4C1]